MTVPSSSAFASSVDGALIAAPGPGNYIHIVGMSIHNNDNTTGNDVIVRLKDGSAGSNLYGGATGAMYLPARGGTWDIPLSYDNPYWDLSENTEFYLDVSATRIVSGCVWYYTDTIASSAISHATFDITSSTSVISAVAAQTIKIVALSLHNNDTSNDENVHIYDGDPSSAGTDLYGTSAGAIYIPDSGGVFGLPLSYSNPWFELTTNTAFYIKPSGGYQVSGTVWYIQD